MKKLPIFLCVSILTAMTGAAAAADPCQTPECKAANQRLYNQFDVFSQALQRIQDHYIRPVDNPGLIDKAIAGMARSLDPHSSYLTPDEFKAISTRTLGEDAGVGLTLTKRDAFAKVIAPLDGSPAAAAGIKSGDLIAEIDGQSLDGVSLDRVIDMLHGPLGSSVTLTVLRAGADLPLTVTIRRQFVHIDAVTSKTIGGIGYVKVSSLTEGTAQRIRKAINTFKSKPAGYILDLRDDPGGLLDEAIAIADLFIETGNIAVTRGRDKSLERRFGAHKGDITHGLPLVVLVNEGSAAGAEIIAGALQDTHRATIVGMPTFGNGTIQTMIPLENGGALKLTTNDILLPSGRGFQEVGILPDILVAQTPKSQQTYPLIAYTAAKR